MVKNENVDLVVIVVAKNVLIDRVAEVKRIVAFGDLVLNLQDMSQKFTNIIVGPRAKKNIHLHTTIS
jgi:hypothetical protein